MRKVSDKEVKEMANYIWSILKTALIIVMSWGVSKIASLYKSDAEYGLRIKVNGFKHKGYVDILYNLAGDCFTIYLTNCKHKVINTIDYVYVDNLISTIDNAVEYCENYNEKVKEYLNKQ